MNNAVTDKPTRTVGKRGKDKQPRKLRNDTSPNTALPDNERMRIMKHNMQLYSLGRISDPNNPEILNTRVCDYFTICTQNEMIPSVAGFALSLGIDRATLWTWISGTRQTIKNPQCVDILKNVYNYLNAQYEDLMNSGKINPVAGIFLMKNNMGYKDQTDHVVTARQEQIETEETLLDRAGLLSDGEVI